MFSSEEIKKLATEIANQHIHDSGYVFALIALITFISTALSAFLSSYFTTRGQNYATKTDFDEILKQTKKTTTATESIKSEISGRLSESLEINAMYREKTEALFVETFAVNAWMVNNISSVIRGETPNIYDSPMAKIEMYQVLYFPEAVSEFHEMELAHSMFLDFSNRTLLARGSKDAVFGSEDYLQVHDECFKATTVFREKLLEIFSNRS